MLVHTYPRDVGFGALALVPRLHLDNDEEKRLRQKSDEKEKGTGILAGMEDTVYRPAPSGLWHHKCAMHMPY